MKISVIIPVYNVAPYIAACLQSVMRQTAQAAIECILVDDCGPDNSMEVVSETLKSYSGPVDFKIVRHTQNRGLSAARNTGMAAATGDYIYFLDSDDEITPDCIERLSAPLQKEPYDLTIGECRIEGGSLPGVALQLPEGTILRDKEILHAYRLQQWYMMSVNKLYRTAFLRSNALQFKEGILHEDELWSFQIASLARSLAVITHETYIYKLRQGSITTNTVSPKSLSSLNTILSEMTLFAQTHALHRNPDAHNIIRNFQIAALSRALMSQWGQALRVSSTDDTIGPGPSVTSNAENVTLGTGPTVTFFPQIYAQQRQSMKDSWLNSFLINAFDLKKQLRDLHLLLPLPLAIPYLKLLLKYYRSQC